MAKTDTPVDFSKYDILYVRAEALVVFAAGSRDIEGWEKPGDGGNWYLQVGTDEWYSITDIRENYGEPKPGMVRPLPDWWDEE